MSIGEGIFYSVCVIVAAYVGVWLVSFLDIKFGD
jgi:hypothetical protein